jgi:hypothetical protein
MKSVKLTMVCFAVLLAGCSKDPLIGHALCDQDGKVYVVTQEGSGDGIYLQSTNVVCPKNTVQP